MPNNPVNIAFALFTQSSVRLFIHPDKVNKDLAASLADDGVTLTGYTDIDTALGQMPDSACMLLDPDKTSACLASAIPSGCRGD